ncbi:MAG: hypothetical protein LBO20_00585 [Bifidobacteriaceae bacterium]|nr:hypothetical protein [Bifidobacteriaceae bacterium]
MAEVKRFAKRRRTSVSAVVQLFAEEALRRETVPGVVFRDGPAGRRAAVEGGPDVWEVVDAVRGALAEDASAPATVAVTAAAQGEDELAGHAARTGLPRRAIAIGLDYYSRYPDEIDQWIADNRLEAEQAHAAWLVRQTLR